MATTSRFPLVRPLAVLAALLALSPALAQPTLGLIASPFTGGWPDLTLAASLPFATYESAEGPVEFAARLDVTLPVDLSELPAVGLGATGTFVSHDMLQPYFGLGARLGWSPPPTEAFYVTPTLLVGLRVPLDPTWAVRVEGNVAPLQGAFGVGVGVDLFL